MKILILFAAIAAVATAARNRNVRVEFKLMDYENKGDVLADGSKCSRSGHCSPDMVGYVDTEKPMNPWPGPKPKISSWTKIFSAKNVDRVDVGKIVSRDVCDGSDFSKANLRVDIVNPGGRTSSDKEIEQFECMSGRDVAPSEKRASWSAPKPCDAKFNPKKQKLMFIWRAFEIDQRSCGKP